jgi:hypothetical protein
MSHIFPNQWLVLTVQTVRTSATILVIKGKIWLLFDTLAPFIADGIILIVFREHIVNLSI